ncbi:hypothetical protein ACIBBD_09485 [Streptomyces sp. NPDC051315]
MTAPRTPPTEPGTAHLAESAGTGSDTGTGTAVGVVTSVGAGDAREV